MPPSIVDEVSDEEEELELVLDVSEVEVDELDVDDIEVEEVTLDVLVHEVLVVEELVVEVSVDVELLEVVLLRLEVEDDVDVTEDCSGQFVQNRRNEFFQACGSGYNLGRALFCALCCMIGLANMQLAPT